MRGSNAIPFHIPHKRLLEKIEHKEVEPEPLVSHSKSVRYLP